MKAGVLFALAAACAGHAQAMLRPRGPFSPRTLQNIKRDYNTTLPIVNVTTITSPTGVRISYKEPVGVCELTPGVKTYTGYVELAQDMHAWFWFFESRNAPETDPVTLWLNGGPGSDSEIGLFQELGPCSITEQLTPLLNPYSWNEVSNMIFLSQPYGVGFSYQDKEFGSENGVTGALQNSSTAPATGYFPVVDADEFSTTELCAIAAWNIIQGLYSGLPQFAPEIKSLEFNLWTESYGGHYGPAFFDYFYNQNEAIGNGSLPGKHLNFNTLGIINGIISERIQVPQYPEFALHNTYGIKLYNQTIYDYTQIALHMPNGCLDYVHYCAVADRTTESGQVLCAEATNLCRDNVEGMYYNFGNRGIYDIREPYNNPTPPTYFAKYLNLPSVQEAIGVNTNYSTSNNDIYYSFARTGDFVYPDFLKDLERILNNGVSVGLFYGDADYICNWFGGQAVAQKIKYAHQKEFRAAGYVPFVASYKNGTKAQFGETKQYGNFSFTRIYEAGHEVPYYQPEAALAFFTRSIKHLNIADGSVKVTSTYGTKGTANTTHTESFVPLPSKTKSPSSASKGHARLGPEKVWL